MPSFWLPKQHYSSNHRGFKLLDSPRDQALWRKIRRALSPPEPPPHPAHTSRSYPVSSTWGRIFCAVSFLPVHSSRLHFPGVAEPVRWRSSPINHIFWLSYLLYPTEPLSFGLSAPVRASMSSEANPKTGEETQPYTSRSLAENDAEWVCFSVGSGQLAPHKADVKPNWPNKSESIAETFS